MDPYTPIFEEALYRMLGGGMERNFTLKIGEIPWSVAGHFRCESRSVMLSMLDAEKIRFHPQHRMNPQQAARIVDVVHQGDYYVEADRGSETEVCAVLHEAEKPKRCHFLVISLDADLSAWHYRTFYRSTNMSRSKFRGGQRIHWPSQTDYFKI